MSFGKSLKKLRLKNGISQRELSNALNVAVSTISRYESEKRSPNVKSFKKLADYFNISIDELYHHCYDESNNNDE